MLFFRDTAMWAGVPPAGAVFTTLRGAKGWAIDASLHAERLVSDARDMGIEAPSAAHIVKALNAVTMALSANWTQVRLRATIAPPPHADAVWIDAEPYGGDDDAPPLSLWPVVASPSATSHLKRCDRTAYAAAIASARIKDADDALLVTADGYWLETTRFAIVGVAGNTLRLPPLAGILPSIGRARLCMLASSMGLAVAVRSIDHHEAASFSEVLAVNSLRGVQAVGRCGEISWPVSGVVTQSLKEAYAGFVAQAILYPPIKPYNES